MNSLADNLEHLHRLVCPTRLRFLPRSGPSFKNLFYVSLVPDVVAHFSPNPRMMTLMKSMQFDSLAKNNPPRRHGVTEKKSQEQEKPKNRFFSVFLCLPW